MIRISTKFIAVFFAHVIFFAPSVLQAGERVTVYETLTEEAKSWNSWESKEAACQYAEKRAASRAKKKCDEELKGEFVKITPNAAGDGKRRTYLSVCNQGDCQRTKSGKYWYCWAQATIKCKYEAEMDDPGLVTKLKSAVRGSDGSLEVGETPCDADAKDAESDACKDYREERKTVGGVKG